MNIEQDLPMVEKQESELEFSKFDADIASELGNALMEIARADANSIAVAVRLWDRDLFFSTMPGLTRQNELWIARKIYLVRHFHQSSYRMALRFDMGNTFEFEKRAISPKKVAFAGGAFPINVRGVGCIGAVCVSGLPHRMDHDCVVRGLCAVLDVPEAEYRLPGE